MRISLKYLAFLTLVSTLALGISCSDTTEDGQRSLPGTPVEGVEGLSQTADGIYHDTAGRSCTTPTPCGDCDTEGCKAAGNPTRPVVSGNNLINPNNINNINNSNNGGGNNGEPFDPFQDICSDLDIELLEATPTVVLLIDQSGSMTELLGTGQNRFDATYDALMDPADGLVADLQGRYRFGLALYTSFGGGPTCPEISDVRPGFNNYDPIDRVFSRAEPESDTPTGEAIEGIMRMFVDEPVRGSKVVLLATDGEPDTCAEPNPQNGQQRSIEAAQQAHARGVETVVLSVGSEVSEQHLQDMANAGVGKAVNDPAKAPFFRADDPATLKNTMKDIIVGSRGCIFQIEGGIVDPALAPAGRVEVNGQPQTYGDGWTLHFSQATCFGAQQCIELTGAACDAIQAGNASVNGDFDCVYGDPDGDNGYGGEPRTPPVTNNGTNNGTPGMCTTSGGGCEYDGDCCSGLCGAGVCVLN